MQGSEAWGVTVVDERSSEQHTFRLWIRWRHQGAVLSILNDLPKESGRTSLTCLPLVKMGMLPNRIIERLALKL